MKNKVKAVLMDTGVDKNHEYLKDNIIGGMSFSCDDEYITADDNYEDENGHGTSCASVIKREFKDVEIFAVKVLDEKGRTNIQILEEALKYFLDKNFRLINLSLSVIENEEVEDLYGICGKLKEKGKIIVCSLANGFEKSYPASFDNVIGVKGFILEDENSFWYSKDKDIQCIMDNNPYMNCKPGNSYALFGKCNSQAAGKLTGKIARMLSEEPEMTFESLNDKLEIMARRNNWTERDLQASKRYPDFKKNLYDKNSPILLKTADAVKEALKLDKSDGIYEYGLFSRKIGLTYDNCFEVLKKLEGEFNIKFDYPNISRYDFISIETLTDLVAKTLSYQKDNI